MQQHDFTFKLLKTISPATQEMLVEYLEERRDSLQPDVSNYAKGRARAWLPRAWDLLNKKWIDEPVLADHARLWDYVQRTLPLVDVALVIADQGIKLHRDDKYATEVGFGINLGAQAKFTIEADPKWSSAGGVEVTLNPGDVYTFITKMRHSAEPLAEGRWNINGWIVKDEWKKGIA